MSGGYYDPYAAYGSESQQSLLGNKAHRRGCSFVMRVADGKVWEDGSTSSKRPTIRSYDDGIKVGCTFITDEAFDQIYRLHKAYRLEKNCRTHQE